MKSSTEVTLSGSFANATGTPTEVGFYWGLSSGNMNKKTGSFSGEDISLELSGLNPGTQYCYQAYAVVPGSGDFFGQQSEFLGELEYFTTKSVEPAVKNCGWLELPGAEGDGVPADYVVNTYYAGSDRNYTHLYDKGTYSSLWTAYPLYASTTGGSRSESWAANPSSNIPESSQINTWKGSYGVSYGSTIYARGHQIPDADRSNNATMQAQTYYATNLVPQIQDKFNGGIWMNLENALRNAIPASDTLYVVTGVTFKTVGGNESITYIRPQNDTKKECPVPNYFWKVVMKVKRNGSTVTSASTVGFWFEHKQYTDTYDQHAVSVDQIEELTGFDFFVNLPDVVESAAESNSYWSTFSDF